MRPGGGTLYLLHIERQRHNKSPQWRREVFWLKGRPSWTLLKGFCWHISCQSHVTMSSFSISTCWTVSGFLVLNTGSLLKGKTLEDVAMRNVMLIITQKHAVHSTLGQQTGSCYRVVSLSIFKNAEFIVHLFRMLFQWIMSHFIWQQWSYRSPTKVTCFSLPMCCHLTFIPGLCSLETDLTSIIDHHSEEKDKTAISEIKRLNQCLTLIRLILTLWHKIFLNAYLSTGWHVPSLLHEHTHTLFFILLHTVLQLHYS